MTKHPVFIGRHKVDRLLLKTMLKWLRLRRLD